MQAEERLISSRKQIFFKLQEGFLHLTYFPSKKQKDWYGISLIMYTTAVILMNCHKMYFYIYIFILINSWWYLFSTLQKSFLVLRDWIFQIWHIGGRWSQFSSIIVAKKTFILSVTSLCLLFYCGSFLSLNRKISAALRQDFCCLFSLKIALWESNLA